MTRPILLAMMLAAGLVGGCRAEEPATNAADLAPDFTLARLDGGSVALDDYDGKVLLVEFWATWCTPCRAQATILEAVYDDFAERDDVEFLGVSVGEKEETVRSFVDKMDSPFPYPVAIDPEDELSAELMIYALPTVMIVDRDRRVVFFEAGLSTGDILRRELEAALGAGSRRASTALAAVGG